MQGSGAQPPTFRVFICYRRDDTGAEAVLLRERLTAELGPIIGMDIAIPAGVDWRTWIEDRLATCDAAIVLIGRQWLTMANAQGHKLGDPEDQLTHEIKTALERDDVTVIPVLVQEARMPALRDLPPPLRAIDRPQALEVSLKDWDFHGRRLVDEVERVLTLRPDDEELGPEPRPWGWIAAGAAVVVIVVAVVVGWLATQGDDSGSSPPEPLVVSPGSIDFGALQAGSESLPEDVTIVNNSPETVPIQAFAITPEGSFERQDEDCIASNPLPPGENCIVRVLFNPGGPGSHDARFIVLRQGTTRAQAVALSGSATGSEERPPESEPVETQGTAAVTTLEGTALEGVTAPEENQATTPP